VTVGRFAPSPSGPLHLGNLRTALLAWSAARHVGGTFLLRMEDLTTGAAPVAETEQRDDLATLGLTHDGEVVRQSERRRLYDDAVRQLVRTGLTYDCYCSRREIRDAAAAPHGVLPEGAYPGTCRQLSATQIRMFEREGRRPALRLRGDGVEVSVVDELAGPVSSWVDDLVLRRADGVAAYNLAVVVDDAAQAVDQVVRGDDLLDTTPRQVLLQRLLGLPSPRYLHVPLALGADGERLAKRHGAVGLADQLARGATVPEVIGLLASSAGLAEPGERLSARDVAARFDVSRLHTDPWIVQADQLVWSG
jgi:glutamyl-tRNA synthetase